MENIQLNNGSIVSIGSNKDVIEVIAEQLSFELSRLIEGKIEAVDSEKLYAEQRLNTDLYSYEIELEEKITAMSDAVASLEKLEEYIEDAKKIDRTKLLDAIRNAIDYLSSEL